VEVVSFTPRPLYSQGKNSWNPLDRRLGRSQSQFGRGGEEKNSQPLPRLEPLIVNSVAQCYTTELTWLLFTTMKTSNLETWTSFLNYLTM
jgi:hypothetical protein